MLDFRDGKRKMKSEAEREDVGGLRNRRGDMGLQVASPMPKRASSRSDEAETALRNTPGFLV